jgi:hypothetical protein
MSTLATNAITDASGGNTATINSYTPTASNMAGRNLVINGAMQVAQRGTVAAGGSTGLHYGGPDRWRMYQENTAGAYTLSQDTNVPAGEGFGSSFKIDVTTADATVDAADRIDFLYRFEGQELQQIAKGTANAKAMLLSFWVSSPKTGTHIVEFYDTDNVRQVSIPYTVNAANTWEKKELLVPADTVGTFDNDVNLSLQIAWWLMAGSNYSGGTLSTSWSSVTNANRAVGQVNVFDNTANNFYLTGVQLEAGSVATPFEHRHYGQELALCQRYYQQITYAGSTITYLLGTAYNSTNIYSMNVYSLPVTMRSAPAFSTTGTFVLADGLGANPPASTLTFSSLSMANSFTASIVSSGLTTGRTYYLLSTASSALKISAEL